MVFVFCDLFGLVVDLVKSMVDLVGMLSAHVC